SSTCFPVVQTREPRVAWLRCSRVSNRRASMSRITLEEFKAIMAESLPFAVMMGAQVEELAEGRATFRLPYRDDWLRPGGTISGPGLMGLRDPAMDAGELHRVG